MKSLICILEGISNFINNTITWPVVVLIMGFLFKQTIKKLLKSFKGFEGYGFKLLFRERSTILKKKLTVVEKAIAEPNFKTSGFIDTDSDPEIAIPLIYSEIEAAFKKKFGKDYNHDMPFSLHENNLINSEILIILDSMWALKENIHLTAGSRKITKGDIANYKDNARRIIDVIKNLKE